MAALNYDLLARYYDALVSGGEDVAFFVARARKAGGKVLELMAGTGRVAVPIAEAGVEMTCVDSSPAMLSRLRAKLRAGSLDAEVHERDISYLDLATRFALAFIAFHSFEELIDDEARSRALQRIRAHLIPGGRFICTLHDPEVRAREAGPGRDVTRRFVDPESGHGVEMRLTTSFDASRCIVSGEESFHDLDTGEATLELPIAFRLCGRDEFAALARAAGFLVEALHGDYAGGPYEPGRSASMIWTLARQVAL